jgi:hypothetical protein
MKTYILASAVGLALLLPHVSPAAEPEPAQNEPAQKPPVGAVNPEISNRVVALCFTCGGAFPQTNAILNLNGFGNLTVEFGANCAVPLVARADNRPRVCSRPR